MPKRTRTYEYKCACCSFRFQSKEPQDPEKDKGFGTCPKCKKFEKEMNEKDWERLESNFADLLTKRKNRVTFWQMDKEVRRGLILQAIEEKEVELTIR